MISKFQLRSFDGTPTRHFIVTSESVSTDQPPKQVAPTHHVVLVDASGSMHYQMASMRSLIQKVWTLSEFADSNQLVSLFSYAGEGDLREHFSRISIRDVMAAGSEYLAEVSRLRTRGLTSISQSLRILPQIVRDGEITAVSLHSDGYANAPSPTRERIEIRRILKELGSLPNLFINTIAHRSSSDFTLLSEIANAVSGVCVRAPDIRDVYESLYQTTSLLASNTAPVLTAALQGSEYVTFVSRSSEKVLGSSQGLSVRGLSAGGDATFYRYLSVDEEQYQKSTAPVCGEDSSPMPVYAFAYSKIAEGDINTAKYALVSTRNRDIYENHITALAGPDMAALSAAVMSALMGRDYSTQEVYGLDTGRRSVLSILQVLDRYSGSWSLDLPSFFKTYKRRTVARKIGSVNKETGEFVEPPVDTVYKDDGSFGKVTSVNINSTGANVNLTVTRPVSLVWRDTGESITRYAGQDLTALEQPKSYTIVGDGRLLTDSLSFQVHDKRLFKALSMLGVVGGDYMPSSTYTVELRQRPMVEYSQSFRPEDLEGVFYDVAQYKLLLSILNAIKGRSQSESFAPETVAKLREICLTPALNISFPTVNPYSDRDKAIQEGILDSRTAYKVNLGSDQLTSWSSLSSANKELDRRFVVTREGKKVAKPKLDQVFWDPKVEFSVKPLTKRTKLTQVDDIMFPLMSGMLRLGDFEPLRDVLRKAGASSDLIADFEEAVMRQMDSDDALEVLSRVSNRLSTAVDTVLGEMWLPVVFFVGCTGLIPDGYGTTAHTYEEVRTSFPQLKVAKKDLENTFFPVSNDIVLSVSMETVYYTPTKE